jgi:hypothetical protein
MPIDPASLTMQERFQHLLAVISGNRFLQMTGIGKEVPFYICPYKPEDALEMESIQKHLANQLEQIGVRVLHINLYDLSMNILKKDGDFEWLIENEQRLPKQRILEEIQGILDVQTVLVQEIGKQLNSNEYDVLFLSGVGEVYPYIRSHNVLNNLQSVAKQRPTLMFFPGAYTQSLETGASLDLFGRLNDDKYYRAFNIFHCEP